MAYSKQTWVDNDASRPISAARLGVIEEGIRTAHVTADGAIPATQKGQPSGVATLGTDGKVPAAQLPSGTGGGGGAVSSVDGRVGVVTLTDLYAPVQHNHDAGEVTTGTFNINRMAPGSTITVDKDKATFGSVAGAWPTVRPTNRVDITCIFKGNTDPGAIAIDGDEWKVTT